MLFNYWIVKEFRVYYCNNFFFVCDIIVFMYSFDNSFKKLWSFFKEYILNYVES